MMVILTKASLGVLAVLLAQGFFISDRVHADETVQFQQRMSDEAIEELPECSRQAGDKCTVNFQDSNLDRAVRSQLGIAPNEDLLRSEVSTLRTLTADRRNITNLAGLEYATSLTTLNLNRNSINDISPLSSLTSLTELRLNNNTTINDISSLSSLTSLTNLRLNNTTVSDISPLSSLTSLRNLYLKGARVSDISALATLASGGGLGAGSTVDLTGNPLNAAAYTTHIPTLQSRGVTVKFSPRPTVTLSNPTVTLSTDALDVAEAGGIGTYTVVLGNEPKSDVMVTPVSGDETVATVSDPLTFTTINWQTPQQVTVTGVNDLIDNDPNRTVSISHTVTGGGYAQAEVADVTVTATDNDSAGIQVTTGRTVGPNNYIDFQEEDGSMSYTVVLSSQPTANVTVAPSFELISSPQSATLSPTSMIFTSANWNQPQTVTVTWTDDDIDSRTRVGDSLVSRQRITVRHGVTTADGVYSRIAAGENYLVPIEVVEDDLAGVTVSGLPTRPVDPIQGRGGTYTILEGRTDTYTVVLDTKPDAVWEGGNVTVTPVSGDETVMTVSGALTFTPANWNQPQTVTITAVNNTVINDHVARVSLTHEVSGSLSRPYNGLNVEPVEVRVRDNENPLSYSRPSERGFEEGERYIYTVRLKKQPTANVTLELSGEDRRVEVWPTSLSFSSSNWDVAQTVTVTADDDLDNPVEIMASNVLHHVTSTDPIYDGRIGSLLVVVRDNETAGVTLSQSTLTVNEGAAYTVVLDSEPTGEVTVTPTSEDGTVARVSGVLRFTAANWNQPQTVIVTAIDADSNPGRTTRIAHRAAGGGYDGVTVGSVGVTTTDEDTAGIALSRSGLSVDEGGESTYTVRLLSPPTGEVTVTPGSSDEAVATVSDALRFTASNWQTPQEVTVTGVEDSIENDPNRTARISHRVTGGGYAGTGVAEVLVTATDNDTDGFTVSPSELSVSEAGGTVTYMVVLDTRPTGDVTVTPSSSDETVATVSGALTFTASDWQTPQEVTVTGVEDAIDNDPNRTATISHTVSGQYGAAGVPEVRVTATDNDAVGVQVTVGKEINPSTGGYEFAEADERMTYTVVLTSQPTADVTVTPSFDHRPASWGIQVSPALTFTPQNWNQSQTVTVTWTDNEIDSQRSYKDIGINNDVESDDGAYDGIHTFQRRVTNPFTGVSTLENRRRVWILHLLEDDTAGVTISGLPTRHIIEGRTDAYTVVLDTKPSGNVTVTPGSSNETVMTVSNALTFTPANWNQPQTVTITAVNDSVISDYLRRVSLTHEVSSTLSRLYNGLNVEPVEVGIREMVDSVSYARPSGQNLEVGGTYTYSERGFEEGESWIYTVKLKKQPTANVTVELRGGDRRIEISPRSLSFSSSNWDVAQTVTVTADDDLDNLLEYMAAHILHEVTSTDPVYSGRRDDVVVIIRDNETAGVTLSESTLRVKDEAAYTVVLTSEPTGDVTITPTSEDGTVASVSGALRFTAANWNQPQTVTVTGINTASNPGQTTRITHRAAGGDYGTVSVGSVDVTTTNENTSGIVVSRSELSVDEAGGTNTYTVRLLNRPTGEVTLTPGSSDETVATVSGELTFTTSNWRTAQEVTVTGVEDRIDNNPNRTARISHTATGGGYAGTQVAEVLVTATDNDTAGVTVSESELSVSEAGGTRTYTVVLDTEPTGDVVVTPVSSDDTVATVSGDLTFTTSNWQTAQEVTVTGVEDSIDNDPNRTATISHTVAIARPVGESMSDGYGAAEVADVRVTATDNDQAWVQFSVVGKEANPTNNVFEFPEPDASMSYTVVLRTQPTADVRVTPRIFWYNSTRGAALSPALTFTPQNWNQPQTATATWTDDDVDGQRSHHAIAIIHDVESNDGPYDDIHIGRTILPSGQQYIFWRTILKVHVFEDDTAGVTVSGVPSTPIIKGNTDTYTVVLDTKPTGDVTVTPGSSDETVMTVSGALTFTRDNWNQPQEVTITSVDDDELVDYVRRVNLTHEVSGPLNKPYNGLSVDPIEVSILDDQIPVISSQPSDSSFEEGESWVYTLRLKRQPTANVRLAISGNGGLEVSPPELIFSSSNWNVAQTVTVTGDDDIDNSVESRTGTITHEFTSTDATYNQRRTTIDLTIRDNETAGVTLSESALRVDEDGTYTVVLNTEPTGEVSITPTSEDGTVASVSGVLRFTAANWDQPQTVTVTRINTASNPYGTTRITHRVTGGGYDTVSVGSVRVDTIGVIVTPTSLTTEEGHSSTYTVKLASPPTGEVRIKPLRSDGVHVPPYVNLETLEVRPVVWVSLTTGQVLTASNFLPSAQTELTFNASNWNIPQTVTVLGVDDSLVNGAPVSTTIRHSISGGGYDNARVADVGVTRTDDDSLGFNVSETGLLRPSLSISTQEGRTTTYSFSLGSRPSGDVIVTPTSSDPTVAIASGPITVTPDRWLYGQWVTVTGVDDNIDNAANRTATITHSLEGGGYTGDWGPVTVTVINDDTVGVTLSQSTLRVNERGAYTVVLDSEPTGDVSITPTSGDGTVASVSGVLRFTAENWNQPQSVTVTGINVASNPGRSTSITHRAVGGGYDGMTVGSVNVTFTDEDTSEIIVSRNELRVDEAGGTDTYTVRLATPPTGEVTVTPSSSNETAVTVSEALTFTTSNWQTVQEITVTAVEDSVDNDPNRTATISHTVTGGGYAGAEVAEVTVAVTDDDTAGVTVSATEMTLAEASSDDEGSGYNTTTTYTVVLDSQPTGDVTVTPSSSNDTAVTVSEALTFTTSNWQMPQEVTVTAVDDNIDNDHESLQGPRRATISHGVSGGGYGEEEVADVAVTVVDDGDTAGVQVSTTKELTNLNSFEFSEADETMNYTVVLTSQPTGDVTVRPRFHGTGAAHWGARLSLTSMTFTSANWNQPQTVAVTWRDNDVDSQISRQPLFIDNQVVSADRAYHGMDLNPDYMRLDLMEDDTAGVTISRVSTIAEGNTDTYTVVLDTKPTGNVTVTPVSSDETLMTVSGELTFTPTNWNTAQTVTLTAIDDSGLNDHIRRLNLTHEVSGPTIGPYNNLSIETIEVDIIDAWGRLIVSVTYPPLLSSGAQPDPHSFEEGESRSYKVMLTSQPTVNVRAEISGNEGLEVSPTELIFSSSNWNQFQTVTVTADDEIDNLVDQRMGTITHELSSTDVTYNGRRTLVHMTIRDNDTAGVTLSENTLRINRGATYTVVLNTEPTGDVSITPTIEDGTVASVSGALRFTAVNWNQPQTVTVTEINPASNPGQTTRITHRAAGGGYDRVTVGSVGITTTNANTSELIVSQTELSVDEAGGTNTYTVRLLSLPTGDVTVTPRSADHTVAAVSEPLTFTTSNWQIPQEVTVTGVEDRIDNDPNRTARIFHTMTGGGYPARGADEVVVTAIDNDTDGVTVSGAESELTVSEAGGTVTYTVVLDAQPKGYPGEVIVTPSSSDETVATVSGPLRFTAIDWQTPKQVTVTGVDDYLDNDPNRTATISHTVTGVGYNGAEVADVRVTATDNDAVGVQVTVGKEINPSTGGYEFAEADERMTYTVVLTSQPTADVTVTPSFDHRPASWGIQVSPALTFTPQNWNQSQTVTVTWTDNEIDSQRSYKDIGINNDVESDDGAYDGIHTFQRRVTNPFTGVSTLENRRRVWILHLLEDDTAGVTISGVPSTPIIVGNTDTYTVVLDTKPTGNVTVTPGSSNETVMTVSNALTFTPDNWNQPQEVAITSVDDRDLSVNIRRVNLTHEVSGRRNRPYNELSVDPIELSILDDRSSPVISSQPSNSSFQEGQSWVYTLKLRSQPTANVRLGISGNGGLAISPPELTFSSSNWDVAQTVTVTGDDDIDNPVESRRGTITHEFSSTDATYNQRRTLIDLTVRDNDTAGVTLSESTLTVNEDAAYTVVLNSQPTGDVTITPTSEDGTVVRVSGVLRFTAANWNQPQTVTVTEIDATSNPGQTTRITHGVEGGGYDRVSVGSVDVTTTDEDTSGVIVSTPSESSFEEGESWVYTVRLKKEPIADVTLQLSDNQGLEILPTQLTFSSRNWDVAQTVTVTVDDDIDNSPTERRTARITHQLTSTDVAYNGRRRDVSVTIRDNDTVGITLSQNTLTVKEEAAYTVVLTSQPTGEVTITPTSEDGTVATVSGVLRFTAANWNQPQSVTVTGINATSNPGQTTRITHSAAGGDYNGVSMGSVAITTTNEETSEVILSRSELSVDEAGGTATYTVRLASPPTGEVTVTPSSSDETVATVSEALTFTTSNWQTVQEVTVTAVEDRIDNDPDRTARITHGVTGGGYAGAEVAEVLVTATDDDTVGVTVSATEVGVAEANWSDQGSTYSNTTTYTVVLDTQPTGDVTVTPSSSDGTVATVSRALRFTTSNWQIPQEVTVTGVDDNIDNDPEWLLWLAANRPQQLNRRVTISHSVSGGDYGEVEIAGVAVTVTDDGDTAGVQVTTVKELSNLNSFDFSEADETLDYKVVLTSQPTADVTVKPRFRHHNYAAYWGATLSLTSMTFTSANWNQPQTVTVTWVDNDVDSQSYRQSLLVDNAVESADRAYHGIELNPTWTRLDLIEDDITEVTVSDVPAVVEGNTDTYTVVLGAKPSGNVTVTPGSSDETLMTVSGQLTFTPANWNQAQEVTITAVDDSRVSDYVRRVNLTHQVSGPSGYARLSVDPIEVTILDNNEDPVAYSLPSSRSFEEGQNWVYTVRLKRQPTANVTLDLSGNNGLEVSPTQLSFSSSNWDDPQTVTVTADDEIDNPGEPRSAEISHQLTSTDATYNGRRSDVRVAIRDNDTAGITLSQNTLTVNQGAAYTVVLNSEPTGEVTITPTSEDRRAVSVSGVLRFTPANWNQPQTVTVTGERASSGTEDIIMITHSAVGGGYDRVSLASVAVTITSENTSRLIVSRSELSVDEAGGTNTYTVRLASPPTGEVTVTPRSSDETVATVSGALIFKTSNWQTVQEVTVTGVEDIIDNDPDRTVRITHAVTGGGYAGAEVAEVLVTTTDNDTAAGTVSARQVYVAETSWNDQGFAYSNTTTYTVVLDTQPTGDVTVTPSSSDDTVATVSRALTFTTSNWQTPQEVTVTGVDDNIDNDPDWLWTQPQQLYRRATISHEVSGGGYGEAEIAEVAVVVTDDGDAAGVQVTTVKELSNFNSFDFSEADETLDYKVVLTSQPTADVTVKPRFSGRSGPHSHVAWGATLSLTSMTFTSANWNQPQTVTMTWVDNDIDSRMGNDLGSQNYRQPLVVDNVVESADRAYHGIELSLSSTTAATISSLRLDLMEDDTAGVTVSRISTVVEGNTDTYTVVLDSKPTGNVTVEPVSSNETVMRVSGELTFTPDNWNEPQEVTITAVDDSVINNNFREVSLTHEVSGPPNKPYNGLSVDPIEVSILDNEHPLDYSWSGGVRRSFEEGGRWTYTVRLKSQPTAEVTMTLLGHGGLEVLPTGLNFSTSNWNTPQTVTVTSDDDIDSSPAEHKTGYISHALSSTDATYNGRSSALSVTVRDNDTAGVTLSATGLSVAENGETGIYTVRLDTQPTHDVTLVLTSSDTDVATVSVEALTFTPTNWNQPQTITVTGVDNDIINPDRTAIIRHTSQSSDQNYNGVEVAEVEVTTTDNDATVTVTPTDLSVLEAGGISTYTVVLDNQPTAEVTVTPTIKPVGVATISAPLTFTTANWNQPQEVTVTGMEDNVITDPARTANIVHTIEGGGYDRAEVADVTVTAIQDLTAPTVAIARPVDESGLVTGDFNITITFSEPVTGFEVGNLTVDNGTVKTDSFSGSGASYTAMITPSEDGPVTVDIAANAVMDVAGNGNEAAPQFSVTADLTAPTVAIARPLDESGPVNGDFNITITFSESVTGFGVDDLSVGNGTVKADSFSGSGASYTATITPTANYNGTVTVDIAADAATDAANRGNMVAAQFSVTADQTAPTVAIARPVGETGLVTAPFNITITFTEPVTGFEVGNLTVDNGTAGSFSGSGASYTAMITPSGDGPVTVDIAASTAMDAAGNGNEAAPQFSVTADIEAPTVAIARPLGESGPVNGDFNITITFSESVTGFGVDDLSVGNGTVKVDTFSGSGASYTATITPTANYNGTVTVDIAGDAATDAANRGNTVAVQFSVTADIEAPTVAIARPVDESGLVTGDFNITITFTEPVTGFEVGNLTVDNGTAGSFSGSGASYTAMITPSEDGPVTVDIAANAVMDAAGNGNEAAPQFSVTADLTAPTVAIARSVDESGPVNGDFNITITFSESVTGFNINDLTVGNGTVKVGTFSGSGASYTATITPTANYNGTVTVDIAGDAATDAANRGNMAAAQFSVTADIEAPTVAIARPVDESGLVTGDFNITITFTEPVTGFEVGNLTVDNGTVGSFSGSGASYRAMITPSGDGPVTVDIAANAAMDAAGNGNEAAPQFSVTADLTAPTVAIARSVDENGPVNGDFNITITFSESVTGFNINDLTVGNGTVKAGTFSGSGASYTATITPTANYNGAVTVDIAANAATDAANRGNMAAAQFSVTADQTAPTVAIARPVDESGLVNGDFNITITFTEPVTGFKVGNLTVDNGTAGSFSGSGASYTAMITPSEDGPVTVDIAANAVMDAAGNGNEAAPQFSVTADLTAPTVAIARPVGESGPVNGDFNITITFSESVTGFNINDLTVGNGTVKAGTFSGSGASYTATITPTANYNGAVTVDIAADAATDAANRGNMVAAQFSVTADIEAPTVAIARPLGQSGLVNGDFNITITFSESVTGFTINDLTVGNGTVKVGTFSGSRTTYTAMITPSGDGPVTVDIAADVAMDAAGNNNEAAPQFSVTADIEAPTVAIARSVGESGPVNGEFNITITFSESVTGFTINDLTVGNGTVKAGSFSGSGTTYTATITPTLDGSVTVDIAADVAIDGAGNSNEAATQFSVTNDTTASIPDANLRAVLESALSKSAGEPIRRSELAGLTSLRANNRSIANLTGLEHATGLTILTIGRNSISDISALSGLTALETLNLNFNNITDLTPLSGLTALRTLKLHSNGILDIAPLAANSGLASEDTINLVGNAETLNAAAYNTHIPALQSRGVTVHLDPDPHLARIPDVQLRIVLEGVLNKSAGQAIRRSELAGLTSLRANNRSIGNLAGLQHATGLTTLTIGRNRVSDISALSDLTALETLNLNFNNITDLTPLSGLTALRTLKLHSNGISDITPLVANTGLGSGDTIDLRGNAATLNTAAYNTHIPALQGRGVTVQFDARPAVAQLVTAPTTEEDVAVSIRAVEPSVIEGEPAQFQLTAVPAPRTDLVVGITVADPDSVLVDTAPTEVTIPANQSTALIELETDDDEVDELDATVTITLEAATNADYGIAAAPDNSASVAVIDNDGLTQERREEGIEHALGAFGRAAGWDLVETIRERSRTTGSQGKAFEITNLPSFGTNGVDRPRPTSMDLFELLERDAEVRVTFNPQVAQASGSESSNKSPLLRAWLRANRTDLRSDPFEGRTQEGEVTTGRLGVDVAYDSGWLVGSVFSWHDGNIEFDDSTFSTEGEVDINLFSINPYVSFTKGKLHLWGTIGGGLGTLSYEDSPTDDPTSTSSDLRMLTAAAGAEYEFGRLGPFDLKGRGEGAIVNLKADDSSHTLVGYDDIGVTVYGARGELELGLPVNFDSNRTEFRPYVFTGLRQDGGLGNDLALEYGGGFALRTGSLVAEGSIRSQFGREDDAVKLTGYSISLAYDRGDDHKGVVAKLEQSAGPSDYDPYGAGALSSFAGDTATRFHLGYGISWDEQLLRPFVEMDWQESQRSGLDIGLEYQYGGGSANLGYSDGELNLGFKFEKLF